MDPVAPISDVSILFFARGFTSPGALRIIRAVNTTTVATQNPWVSLAPALRKDAQVVKLVDTPASGAGGRKAVEVRVFSWAPFSYLMHSHQICYKPIPSLTSGRVIAPADFLRARIFFNTRLP